MEKTGPQSITNPPHFASFSIYLPGFQTFENESGRQVVPALQAPAASPKNYLFSYITTKPSLVGI